MAVVVLTGCSRGLGLEITKQLAATPSIRLIFATARGSTPSLSLAELVKGSEGRIRFVSLDVTSPGNVSSAAQVIEQDLNGAGVDILINNAGIQILEPGGVTALSALETTLATNVNGVANVSSAFMPLLAKGSQKKLINITSTLGSIGLKEQFAMAPCPSYKVSKAALNMLTAQYALEFGPQGYIVFALSPGWLTTELGGARADLPPELGAKKALDIILHARPEDNGAFRNIHVPGTAIYDGRNPPW